jgi:exosome complex component CSL4
MSIPGYVVPGQIICPIMEKDSDLIRKYQCGAGVTLTEIGKGLQALTATLVGKVNLVSLDGLEDEDIEMTDDSPRVLSFEVNVESKLDFSRDFYQEQRQTRRSTSILPEVGDIVLARVTKLTAKQAHVEVLVVENSGAIAADSGIGYHASGSGIGTLSNAGQQSVATADVGEGFGGIIRIQDVRATERDKVKIQDCFKPGDIVRASVLSLGDGTNYYLSTAQNDLGVIFARSAVGEHMYPVDWQTMKCSATGVLEPRKCAKPFLASGESA